MPTKGKLPTAREMKGQVLAALQELLQRSKVEVHYTDIDERVRKNLEPFVLVPEFKVPSKSFYGTTFANKCAQARGALREDGVLVMGAKKGHWRFVPPMKPSKKRKPGTSRVSNFAAESIDLLKEQRVDPEAIKSICQLFREFQMAGPEAQLNDTDKPEVEAEAIAFILKQEKDWQRPENRNNPGFDLYQTGRRGQITRWCEVKSLSGEFSGVSLTHTEFKEALKRGKRYWLYIVENVGSDDVVLIKINDPAGKAERFTYGTHWRKAAAEVIHSSQGKLMS